jgi:hypothetical protein
MLLPGPGNRNWIIVVACEAMLSVERLHCDPRPALEVSKRLLHPSQIVAMRATKMSIPVSESA